MTGLSQIYKALREHGSQSVTNSSRALCIPLFCPNLSVTFWCH